MTQIDPRVASYLVRVAEALEPLKNMEPPYGEYHITRVSFGFDGEPVDEFSISFGEFGELVINVT